MSKSYGNAIGINEPPLEMYGKVMSITDEMMWRYYELLTDAKVAEIERMKREAHPMQAKKDLALGIVKDFHSAQAAARAAEDWAKQFQKDEVPESVEQTSVAFAEIASKDGEGARLDKLLARVGLAQSVSEAGRKIKEKAVSVDGQVVTQPAIALSPGTAATLRVGRKIKKVLITS
jgi:tyrosyl-tRNA synthetase